MLKSVIKGDEEMPEFKFAWVEEELKGIYGEEWDAVKRSIGIPQGGALSLFIANIVLNDVDKEVLAKRDGGMFFCRYCDDMVLMHTERERCQRLIETYIESLTAHKLIPHKGTKVRSCKDGEKITKEFWNIKSHETYRWGSGDGDASHWVGFLGYEMNSNGETRMRHSSLEKHKARVVQYSLGVVKTLKQWEEGKSDVEKLINRIERNLNHYIERLERSGKVCKTEGVAATSWERQRKEIARCVDDRKRYVANWLKRHPHVKLKQEERERILSHINILC